MKRYLDFINENTVEKIIKIRSENDFHLIKEGVEVIDALGANLSYLPKLPESLIELDCSYNKLKSLPELPENLKDLDCNENELQYINKLPKNLENLYCNDNKIYHLPEFPESLITLSCFNNELKSLSELPENLIRFICHNNPLDFPIPHKFYNKQNSDWLVDLNNKLRSYEHQKKLINENGIYIMKKFKYHIELINDKIKEENPTYFLSVDYGF